MHITRISKHKKRFYLIPYKYKEPIEQPIERKPNLNPKTYRVERGVMSKLYPTTKPVFLKYDRSRKPMGYASRASIHSNLINEADEAEFRFTYNDVMAMPAHHGPTYKARNHVEINPNKRRGWWNENGLRINKRNANEVPQGSSGLLWAIRSIDEERLNLVDEFNFTLAARDSMLRQDGFEIPPRKPIAGHGRQFAGLAPFRYASDISDYKENRNVKAGATIG